MVRPHFRDLDAHATGQPARANEPRPVAIRTGAWSMRLFAISALVSVVACSLVVRSDRIQCASSDDCVGHGLRANAECRGEVCVEPPVVGGDAGDADTGALPEDPIWGCLDKVPAVPFPEKTSPVHFRARFEGLLTGKPLEGLPVKGCTLLDLACDQAVAGPQDTSSDGVTDLELFHGFRGYLDIGQSAAHPDLMPSLLYVLPIPDKNAVLQDPPPLWNLLTKDEFSFAAGSVGKTLKPEYGHLFFAAVDCRGLSAKDATVRADIITSDTFTYYTDTAGTPSLTQAKTSPSGNGGFLNLPLGTVTVTLSREDGKRVGTHNVIIRAGSITYMLFGPTP